MLKRKIKLRVRNSTIWVLLYYIPFEGSDHPFLGIHGSTFRTEEEAKARQQQLAPTRYILAQTFLPEPEDDCNWYLEKIL